MSITKRTLSSGKRVYEIRVSRGRDPLTGKQLPPYVRRYHPPATWSDAKAYREAQIREAQFIAECKAGKVLTKAEERERRKAEAEEAERKRLEEAAKLTFKSYGELWLAEAQSLKEKTPGTINNYRIMLGRVGKVLGDQRLEDLDRPMLQAYITQLFTEGKNERSGEPLAYPSKRNTFALLRAFLEEAAEQGIIPVSPMLGIKLPKRPKEAREEKRRAYTAEEVQHILSCLEREPLMWRAMVTFMLDSGCRRGEVVGLMWEDIDFKTGKVSITRNAQYTVGSGIYFNPPKNGKARSFYLNAQALSVMKEWRREQSAYLMAQGLPRTGFCFTREDGQMLHPSTPTEYFAKLSERYDIPGFHPHTLRHTMATLSIANGADVVSVSTKLGHSNPNITLGIYSHANEEAQRKANELLAEQLYKKA